MPRYQPHLDWIDTQRTRAVGLIERWAKINSASHNPVGLKRMAAAVREQLNTLGADTELIPLEPTKRIDSQGKVCKSPLGDAVHAIKRPEAPIQVFLGIHMDTVYPPDHPFQEVRRIDDGTLSGPGVLDAKGGLMVMLLALEALERSNPANAIGWEVLINPDEEIGSPGSAGLLRDCAERNHIGLVFEPALPNGALVDQRGGSGNFTAVVHGRSAHAGREFDQGRNAIVAAAHLALELSRISGTLPGLTLNVAKIDGGGATNIVPDLAVCRFNLRMSDPQHVQPSIRAIEEAVERTQALDGIAVELHGGITSPPKPRNPATEQLMSYVESCGDSIGLSVQWQATGGVCDGNKLADAGLPTIDTLGPVGAGMHSDQEHLLLDSVTQRAKLTALLLMRLAAGEITVPNRHEVVTQTQAPGGASA